MPAYKLLEKIVRIRILRKKIQMQNERKTQLYHLIDTKWSAQSNPGGQITAGPYYYGRAVHLRDVIQFFCF